MRHENGRGEGATPNEKIRERREDRRDKRREEKRREEKRREEKRREEEEKRKRRGREEEEKRRRQEEKEGKDILHELHAFQRELSPVPVAGYHGKPLINRGGDDPCGPFGHHET